MDVVTILFGTASLGAAVAIKELIEKGSLKRDCQIFWNSSRRKVFWKTLDDKRGCV